jgi:predicted  nucleic acid-binding Zn-ribbon protein
MPAAITIVGTIASICYTILQIVRDRNPDIDIIKGLNAEQGERISVLEAKVTALREKDEDLEKDIENNDHRVRDLIKSLDIKIEKVSDQVIQTIRQIANLGD